MSVESDEMKRSTLQRKDREELTSIARALGGAPSSRARKAELVDLVLELAGDGDSADGDAAGKEQNTGGESDAAEGESGSADDADGSAGEAGADNADGSDDRDGSNDDSDSGDDRRPEPGNRRRRRRGRDRDKQPDEPWSGEPTAVDGFLDLRDEGYGFLRVSGFMPSKEDAYVSVKQVRQFGLRRGDQIIGGVRPANRNEKNAALHQIDSVNGQDPDTIHDRPSFDDITPVFPTEPMGLEVASDPSKLVARIIDLVSPVGRGQRGLIAAPPRSGKTAALTEIAQSVETNHPDVQLIVLLLDERPEEVTELTRALERGEVAASTFDRPPEEHVAAAELTVERAKRSVESGRDVCLLVDGLTRLARSYNQVSGGSSHTLSCGLDAAGLHHLKRIFGAARNLENAGSLTILATVAVGSGSPLDDAVYEEMRSLANMELRLDREAVTRRIHPAVDVLASSTAHDVDLQDKVLNAAMTEFRRSVAADGDSVAGLERLIDLLTSSKKNSELSGKLAK